MVAYCYQRFYIIEGEFPFGQLPVLYIGDEVISQSHSIARFVAKLAGFV